MPGRYGQRHRLAQGRSGVAGHSPRKTRLRSAARRIRDRRSNRLDCVLHTFCACRMCSGLRQGKPDDGVVDREGNRLRPVPFGRRQCEAAGLAMHFEQGRDWPRAVKYLRHAARRRPPLRRPTSRRSCGGGAGRGKRTTCLRSRAAPSTPAGQARARRLTRVPVSSERVLSPAHAVSPVAGSAAALYSGRHD